MKKNTITFGNGNRAVVVTAPGDASAKAILEALEITSPHAMILLLAGRTGLMIHAKLIWQLCLPMELLRSPPNWAAR